MAKKIIIFSIFFVFVFSIQNSAYALTIPDFPECNNPQGTIRAQYDSGTHGIPGEISDKSGKDTVYELDSGTLTQCYCSDSGDGIQTNWWNVSSLTNDELQILKNLGWYFVPDGSLWGLQKASYMAINQTYSCANPTPTPSSSSSSGGGSSSGNNSTSNNSSSNNGGTVIAAANNIGQILGSYAFTGGSWSIIILFGVGIFLILLSILLKKNVKK